MTTWSDLGAHIEDAYGGVADDNNSLGLVIELDGGSEQVVHLTRYRVSGQAWLVVTAEVCADGDFPLRDALDHNGRLAVGALCLQRDRLVLRWSDALGETTLHAIDRAIRVLAREAMRLRALAAPAATVADVFAIYA